MAMKKKSDKNTSESELLPPLQSPLEDALKLCLLTPMGDPSMVDCTWGLPLLLWGSPGIGKSARVMQAGDQLNLPVGPVYAATRAPEDFSGVPVPSDEGINLECILGPARDLIGAQMGLLFLDEISCARPAVQSALLSVVLDRRIGDTLLPPKVRVIAAANPPDEAAGGWELALPLANRFAHIQISPPSVQDMHKWLMTEGRSTLEPLHNAEKGVAERWPKIWARMKGLLDGFFHAKPNLIHAPPPVGSIHRGRSWPSPRSWEMAIRVQAAAQCIDTKGVANTEKLIPEMVTACVGPGAAGEWHRYVREADLPDPQELLSGKATWEPDKLRLDRTFSVYTSLISYIKSCDADQKSEYGPRAWKYIHKLIGVGLADIALTPTKELCSAGLTPETHENPEVNAAGRPVIDFFTDSQLINFL